MNFVCLVLGHVPDLAASIALKSAEKSICSRCKKHIYYDTYNSKWFINKYWHVKEDKT